MNFGFSLMKEQEYCSEKTLICLGFETRNIKMRSEDATTPSPRGCNKSFIGKLCVSVVECTNVLNTRNHISQIINDKGTQKTQFKKLYD